MRSILRLLVASAVVIAMTAADDDLSATVSSGKPSPDMLVDGCGFEFRVPEPCHFTIQPLSTSNDDFCQFPNIGLPVLVEQIQAGAGACTNGFSLTKTKKDDAEEVDWKFGLYRLANGTIGASGMVDTLNINDIIGDALNGIGVKVNDLGIPSPIKNARLAVVRERTSTPPVTWLSLGGGAAACDVELLSRFAAAPVGKGIVVAAQCTNMKFTDFLQKHTKTNMNLDFLAGLAFSFVVSSMDVSEAKVAELFENADLSHMNVPRGFTFVGSMAKPEGCNGAFCKFLDSFLQEDKPFTVSGSIEQGQFSLTGAIPLDVKLGKKASMKDLSLVVSSNPLMTGMDMTFQFDVSRPPLVLTGGVTTSPAGLGMRASMSGLWEKAFGLDFVAFGNVNLAASFVPPNPIPTALELGGKLRLGKKPGNGQTDKRIMGAAYIGINTVDQTQNYFYGSLEITIGRLLSAFGVTVNQLPHIIAKSGFPKGVLASYTTNPAGKSIDELGVNILFGLQASGVMNIMGLSAKADFTFSAAPSTSIFLKIRLPVVKLQNIVTFAGDKSGKQGATALVKFSAGDPLSTKVAYSGYLYLLGMWRSASMSVDNTAIDITSGGKLFNYETIMSIKASYGSLNTMKFNLHATLKSDSQFKAISDRIRNALKAHLSKAKSAIANEKEKVKKAEDDCRKKMSSSCNSCKSAGEKVCGRIKDVCKAKCSVSGAFKKKKKRKRCKNRCDDDRDGCNRRAASSCGSVCKSFTTIAKGLCSVTDAARLSLAATEATYGGIAKVSTAGLSASQLFELRKVTFDTGLSSSLKAEFNCKIEVVVIKKKFNLGVKMNFSGLSKGDVKQVFNDIYKAVKNKF